MRSSMNYHRNANASLVLEFTKKSAINVPTIISLRKITAFNVQSTQFGTRSLTNVIAKKVLCLELMEYVFQNAQTLKLMIKFQEAADA